MGLAKLLMEMGQNHLFEHWPEPGVDDEEKRAFFHQVLGLHMLNFIFLVLEMGFGCSQDIWLCSLRKN